MNGPFKFFSSTSETVTVEYDGTEVTVSNDRCIHDPNHEPYDPEEHQDVYAITDTTTDPTSTNKDIDPTTQE